MVAHRTRSARHLVAGLGLLMGLLLSSRPGAAQSPVITPAGDRSVRDDTIYALAVDSASHPEENFVLLLDDGVVRVERDGTSRKTYRMVAHVLKDAGVDSWAEHTYQYDPEREEFTLNWARVAEKDGRIVSASPLHVQESDVPAAENAPVYTNRKVVRVTLANVAPGRIVDYSYTIRVKKPVLPGDWTSSWLLNPASLVRRSRLILDVPDGMKLHLEERNIRGQVDVQRVGGRVIRTWARADLPLVEQQLFAADSNDVRQSVTAAGWVEWADIARWYAGLAKDRYRATPALEAKLREVTAGARTRIDSLRAVHRWVAQDVRYVSLSLGIGGYQPRRPEEVIETMSGDCKDKATLFVTLARRLGYEAYPVLVAAQAKANESLPSLTQFDHEIAAVRQGDGWTYVDLTADIVPFGEVPPVVTGEFGLLVKDDGSAVPVHFPTPGADQNRVRSLLALDLDEHGYLEGTYRREATGLLQYQLRGMFPAMPEGKARIELTQALASGLFEAARGDSLQISGGKDLTAPVSLSLDLTADAVLSKTAQGWILKLPVPRMVTPQLVAQLEREGERRFPFDVDAVIGPQTQEFELRLTLPAGWTAELPAAVRAESAFGHYESQYTQNGRQVVIHRVARGRTGILPADRKAELLTWLRAVAGDDAPFLVLHPPT